MLRCLYRSNFAPLWSPMATGNCIHAGARFGFRTAWPQTGAHTQMAIGFIPTIGAGTGSPMLKRTTGDGLLIIMVAGSSIVILAGSGSGVMNGDRHGSTGVEARNMSAGHRYRRTTSLSNIASIARIRPIGPFYDR